MDSGEALEALEASLLNCQDPCEDDKIKRWIQLCPQIVRTASFPTGQLGIFQSDLRSHSALLSLLRFLLSWKKWDDPNTTEVIDGVLHYISSGLYTFRKPMQTSLSTSEYQDFYFSLLSLLISISNESMHSTLRNNIVSGIASVLKNCISLARNGDFDVSDEKQSLWPAIYVGVLRALAEKSLHYGDDIAAVSLMKNALFECFDISMDATGFSNIKVDLQSIFIRLMQSITPYLEGALAMLLFEIENKSADIEISKLKQFYLSGIKPVLSISMGSSKRKSSRLPLGFSQYLHFGIRLAVASCFYLPSQNAEELLSSLTEVIRRFLKKGERTHVYESSTQLSPEDPVTFHLKFTNEAIYGIRSLCKRFPVMIGGAVSRLSTFIFDLSESNVESLDSSILDCLVQVLNIDVNLKTESEYSNSLTRSFVKGLEDKLQRASLDVSYRVSEEKVIHVLGVISSKLRSNSLASHILSVLIPKFRTNPKLVHRVVRNLADIAIWCNFDNFEVISSFLVEVYRKPFSPENRLLFTEIRNILHVLSQNLSVEHHRMHFTRTILKLAQSLGHSIHNELDKSGARQQSSIVGTLGFLLPPLAELILPSQDNHTNVTLFLSQKSPIIGFQAFSSATTNVRIFRSIWFFLVLFRLVDSSSDSTFVLPEWMSAIKTIASNTPTLIIKREKNYLGSEIESQTFLTSGIDQSGLQASFCKALPSINISSLSFPKLMYLLTIYHLETLRSSNGSFFAIFEYLEDPGFIASGLSIHLGAIVDKVFQVYIEFIEAMKNGPKKDCNLVNHMIFLLVKMCNREQMVRDKAKSFCDDLCQRFPFLQYNRLCFGAALDLVEILDSRKRNLDVLSTYRAVNLPYVNIKVPCENGVSTLKIDLKLPEKKSVRDMIFIDFTKLVSIWIDTCILSCPIETISIAQEYIQDIQDFDLEARFASTTNRFTSSFGFASTLNPKNVLKSKLSRGKTSSEIPIEASPALSLSLALRQRYIGEICGFYQAFKNLSSASTDTIPFGAYFSSELHKEFTRISTVCREFELSKKSFRAQNENTRLNHDATVLIFRCVSLIIWATERYSPQDLVSDLDRKIDVKELVHLLCVCPSVVFTVPALNAAVFAWRWLFSTNYEYSSSLFISMKSAWSLTIENKKGIFSHADDDTLLNGQYPGCLFSAKHKRESLDDKMQLQPHLIWVQFFEDSIESTKSGYPAVVRAITMMLNDALSNPKLLVITPSSFAIRFRLLLLGLKVLQIQNNYSESIELVELLRDRIYSAAFHWFYESPRWIVTSNNREFRLIAKLIIEFCKTLEAESSESAINPSLILEHHINSDMSTRSTKFSDKSLTPRKLDIASFKEKDFSKMHLGHFETSSKDLSWLYSWNSINSLKGACILSEEFESSRTSLSVKKDVGSGSHRASTVLSQRQRKVSPKELLILLMSHELHRMLAWYNPSRQVDKRKLFIDQEFYVDLCLSTPEYTLANFFELAWTIDPKLAFRMVQRFQFSKILARKLTEKMKGSPWSLYEIGDAVIYLATEENVRSKSESLKHLAYYQPCSLPTALKFLALPFSSNQIVNEYTMRSLGSHGEDAVIFYLNEILQALRYDTFGLLKDFLLKACMKSPYLAHQLIWACQLESEVDIESVRGSGLQGAEDPIPKICKDLERLIISNFSTKALEFYNEEFSFFENITKLSSDLLAIPKSDRARRNLELRNRLSKISLDYSGLYLPIDHKSEVTEILSETGLTLQSSSRVPFLVQFKIKCLESVRVEEEMDDNMEYPDVITPEDGEKREEDERNMSLASLGSSQMFSMKSKDQDSKTSQSEDLNVVNTAVIFKAGDDVRQDCLALQFIRLMKDIMESVGLKLFLMPYKVVPNRTGPGKKGLGGVIECIPRAKSRDELGKSNNRSLKQEFLSRYGQEDGQAYKTAQRNFILSLAGYAVACYILQVKDRHNGNIMIDDFGHIIHIDFGFIFSTSPANDLGFERAGFKFTYEMCELMDGIGSELCKWFEELCVKGFLAVREHADDFYHVANLMMDSPLGCFKQNSMSELKGRFFLDKSEKDAALSMIKNVVGNAYNNVTTTVYDQIQWQKEGIWYFSGAGDA